MKKIFVIFFIILLFGLAIGYAGLLDVYKKGSIEINHDLEFGRDTDWDAMFYAGIRSIEFCKEGDFFIAPRKQHKIFKFDRSGNLIDFFGQHGQGPGDFVHPSSLSVLDNKYLVLSEYATNQRISIFHLSGKFKKLIRTRYPVYGVVALKNGKIAIYSSRCMDRGMEGGNCNLRLYIKDINTGIEKPILSETSQFKWARLKDIFFGISETMKELYYCRTPDGNLIVGVNYSDIIRIYNPEGNLIKSFKIKIKPVKVDSTVIRKHKRDFINQAKKRKFYKDKYLKAFESCNSFDKFFDDYLPFYKSLMVDDEGNILVFKYTGCLDANYLEFQVYSPEGKYICQSKIDYGKYRAPLFDKEYFSQIAIRSSGFYGMVEMQKANEGDTYNKIIRSKFHHKHTAI